jgi:hypothetical protein
VSEADVKPAAPRKKRKKKGAKGKPLPPPRKPWWIAVIAAIVLGAVTVWAWPPRPAPEPHVRQGNTYYASRRYREALGEYESAPGGGARNAGVHLDRGLARYRVTIPPGDGGLPMVAIDASAPEGLSQAQEEMRTAARGGAGGAEEDVDAFLRARAAYDLGNTFFTTHQWDNAIEAYKAALRLRPGWVDAAWNLELARRLRELERNPPDAGQDASQDAAHDAEDSGSDVPDSGNDSGQDGGGMDGGGPDGGSPDAGGRDSGPGDGGRDGGSDGAASPDGGSPDAGAEGPRDGGAPDAAAPRSMAPLDDLDRTSRSLQNELLRRRGMNPRSPDDDR